MVTSTSIPLFSTRSPLSLQQCFTSYIGCILRCHKIHVDQRIFMDLVVALRLYSLTARPNEPAAPGPKKAATAAIDPKASTFSHSAPTLNFEARGACVLPPCSICRYANKMQVKVMTCQSSCVNKCAPSTRIFDEGCPGLLIDGMNKRLNETSGSEEVSET